MPGAIAKENAREPHHGRLGQCSHIGQTMRHSTSTCYFAFCYAAKMKLNRKTRFSANLLALVERHGNKNRCPGFEQTGVRRCRKTYGKCRVNHFNTLRFEGLSPNFCR
jgi:hypothetical protein